MVPCRTPEQTLGKNSSAKTGSYSNDRGMNAVLFRRPRPQGTPAHRSW